MADADDVFTVFISHKHDDHALAVVVKEAIQRLGRKGLINCFVSGTDIMAGTDWRREIRSVLARSHLLILLFTVPGKSWDWCLFETGLYTRFDMTDVGSVVCLFSEGEASPSPLADLQGVPAEIGKVRDFLDLFCRQTWKICDDWRLGALAPEIPADRVEKSARAICEAFERSGDTSTYYPCHRVVLSLSESDNFTRGIPESARVVEGPNETSGYTMSLFDLAGGTGKREWGDLLRAVKGTKSTWRKSLDAHFREALKERLFPRIETPMLAGGTYRLGRRLYRPILYSVERGPAVRGPRKGTTQPRARRVTIVLIPEPLAHPGAESD